MPIPSRPPLNLLTVFPWTLLLVEKCGKRSTVSGESDNPSSRGLHSISLLLRHVMYPQCMCDSCSPANLNMHTLQLQYTLLLISLTCVSDGPTVSNRASLSSPPHYPRCHCRLGAPADWSIDRGLVLPPRSVPSSSPVLLQATPPESPSASCSACTGTAGVCGTAAELPSQFRDRPHHAGLGRPGTSPPTPARIEGQKAALPATLPQSHRHATK
jgi:hypothetical protein